MNAPNGSNALARFARLDWTTQQRRGSRGRATAGPVDSRQCARESSASLTVNSDGQTPAHRLHPVVFRRVSSVSIADR